MHFSLVIFVMVEILSSEFTTAKPRTEIDLLNHADTEGIVVVFIILPTLHTIYWCAVIAASTALTDASTP